MPEVYSRIPKTEMDLFYILPPKKVLGLITGLRNVNIHWPVLPACPMLADQIHCLLFIKVACNGNHKIMRREYFSFRKDSSLSRVMPCTNCRFPSIGFPNGWGPNNALPNSSLTRSSGESSYISDFFEDYAFSFLYHRDP